MPVTPTGGLSLLVLQLQKTIASSSTFQTLTSTGSMAAALAFVLVPQAPATQAPAFAVIELPKSHSKRLVAGRYDNNLAEGTTTLLAKFFTAIANGASAADAFYTLANAIGGIEQDLLDLAGAPLTDSSLGLPAESIELVQAPSRAEAQEALSPGDFFRATLRCTVRGASP